MERRLKREELYIGRKVTYDELRDILDTYIVLGNIDGCVPNLSGTVAYVTDERNEHSTELIIQKGYRCIYNDSMDLDEDVSYDE